MCIAQGHNAVTPVRLEPPTPRSRVKQSSTEPLHPHFDYDISVPRRKFFLYPATKTSNSLARYSAAGIMFKPYPAEPGFVNSLYPD